MIHVDSDSLRFFGLVENQDLRVRVCYVPHLAMAMNRVHDSIYLQNINDSIWRGPSLFYNNPAGDLIGTRSHIKADSGDWVFSKTSNFTNCNTIRDQDFKLVIVKASTEEELYASGEFGLQLHYEINGTGYSYTRYIIDIEHGSLVSGNYTGKYGMVSAYDSLKSRGDIALTVPLKNLMDTTATQIYVRIIMGGRTEDDEKGTTGIFTKEIIYNVRKRL